MSNHVLAEVFARDGWTFDDMEPALSKILADDGHRDAGRLRGLLARYGFARPSDRMGLADMLRAAERRLEADPLCRGQHADA